MYRACLNQLNVWRIQAVNWFKEEKGANEIIAIILILVVVVALAIFFQDEITGLAEDIWGTITGKVEEGGFGEGAGSSPKPE